MYLEILDTWKMNISIFNMASCTWIDWNQYAARGCSLRSTERRIYFYSLRKRLNRQLSSNIQWDFFHTFWASPTISLSLKQNKDTTYKYIFFLCTLSVEYEFDQSGNPHWLQFHSQAAATDSTELRRSKPPLSECIYNFIRDNKHRYSCVNVYIRYSCHYTPKRAVWQNCAPVVSTTPEAVLMIVCAVVRFLEQMRLPKNRSAS